jgi:membrane associated rhomboid family serine protease
LVLKASSWIIILCFLATGLTVLFPGLIEQLAFRPTDLYSSRLWTPVTALFVHAGLAHLLGNMLFLFVLGRTLESEVGSTRFLVVFFVGGVLSFILSVPFYKSDTLMLGASAAIFSVASAVMLIKPLRFSILFLAPVGVVSLLYFLYNVVAVYSGASGNIAYVSHLIGFILGVPFGIAWSKNWIRNLGVSIVLVIVYVILVNWFFSKLVTG